MFYVTNFKTFMKKLVRLVLAFYATCTPTVSSNYMQFEHKNLKHYDVSVLDAITNKDLYVNLCLRTQSF